jgi:hypothetical protein
MSSSTTQQKKSKVQASANGDAKSESVNQEDVCLDVFHRELTKKIRNKIKKLDKISDVEKKVKSKEIDANEEQRIMIASKPAI